jgi:hypothetical protein
VIPLFRDDEVGKGRVMMGRQGGDQASLFYEFRLDDRVPKNHLLRRIDVFVTRRSPMCMSSSIPITAR